jgi:hypothetical protein
MRDMPKSPIFISWPWPTKMLLQVGKTWDHGLGGHMRPHETISSSTSPAIDAAPAHELGTGICLAVTAQPLKLAMALHSRWLQVSVQDVAAVEVMHAPSNAAQQMGASGQGLSAEA